ncbi:MAG: Arc family DNA-binding protein [Candidatus Polarisedimenticolia bacterium]
MARIDGHFRLRLPDDVKEWVRRNAERNMRSMTAEINFALRERMEAATGAKFGDQTPAAALNPADVGSVG